MGKPYSRIKGKICDFVLSNDTGFVRVEVIDIVKELNDWCYLIRFVDGGKKAMIARGDISQIHEVKDLKPDLCLVVPIRGRSVKKK